MDILIGAEGPAATIEAAHGAAFLRFCGILEELRGELPALRRPVSTGPPPEGPIARRMWQACHPFRAQYITPMAAVAGSVAQELISAYFLDGISRAWVNNGGDIAIHLAPGYSARVGLFADLARLDLRQIIGDVVLDGRFEVLHSMPVRGVATSGWRGRSFSQGIADSVTVLARTASEADAAATIIANAVNVEDGRIVRRPACELKDDSDLGDIAVTVDVPRLDRHTAWRALERGLGCAQALRSDRLIWSCVLVCQGWLARTDADGMVALSDNISSNALPLCAGSEGAGHR